MLAFADMLTNQPPKIQAVAHEVRKLILKTDKRIEENIYGGEKVKMSLYSIGDTNSVLYGIGFAKDHVKLFIHHTDKPGADVAGLKLEGKGKHAKTVKLKAIDSAIKKQLQTALKSILEVSGY